MSFSNAKVESVAIQRGNLVVRLRDDRTISVPLTWYPTLVQATAKQLRRWRACGAGTGIHWPDLDYHLSVEGLLRGAREAEGVTRRLMAGV
jgi:hypothetical protein